MQGNKTPYAIWIKFCSVVGIPDVITCANFGQGRLRGLGVVGGQNLPFSIHFDRRPYNNLALLCECVMAEPKFNKDQLSLTNPMWHAAARRHAGKCSVW